MGPAATAAAANPNLAGLIDAAQADAAASLSAAFATARRTGDLRHIAYVLDALSQRVAAAAEPLPRAAQPPGASAGRAVVITAAAIGARPGPGAARAARGR